MTSTQPITFANRILKSLVFSIVVFLLVCSPNGAYAETGDPASDPNFQLVSTTDCGQMKGGQLDECGWADFLSLISRIMKYLIFISGSIAVLMFAYAGFLYLSAFGEMGKVEQAHKIFSSTMMGVIIIMLAWLIVATILKLLEVGPDFTILQGIENVQTSTK